MSESIPFARLHWRVVLWGGLALLLALPLVLSTVGEGPGWGLEDLVAAAVLLGGFGLAVEATVRLVEDRRKRWLIGGLAVLAVALIWAQLAVGLYS